MGLSLPAIQDKMIAAAYEAAAQSMRFVWEREGSIDPRTQVGRLSDKELVWMVSMAISHWITERSKQWSDSRKDGQTLDAFVQAYKPGADPQRDGDLRAALPELGKWCAERGIAARPVTNWSRDDVVGFIEIAWELAGLIRISRMETPEVPSDAERLLVAG